MSVPTEAAKKAWWITDGGFLAQGGRKWLGPFAVEADAYSMRTRIEKADPAGMTYCIDSTLVAGVSTNPTNDAAVQLIVRNAHRQIHDQPTGRKYSVAEVKQIVYPVTTALRTVATNPTEDTEKWSPKEYLELAELIQTAAVVDEIALTWKECLEIAETIRGSLWAESFGRRASNPTEDDPIPRYAQLDIWMALYGSEPSQEYEPFREKCGFAETWARLCAEVRAVACNPTEDTAKATCIECGVTVTDQTPSSFYLDHDERCGGILDEPTFASNPRTAEDELSAVKAAARGLNDVLLHWRDRAAGYMNAPALTGSLAHSVPSAYERVAGLIRDLADGKLTDQEVDRLAHFNEPGECTAYDFSDRIKAVSPVTETGTGEHKTQDSEADRG